MQGIGGSITVLDVTSSDMSDGGAAGLGSWDEEGMQGIGGSITVMLLVLSEDNAFL